MATSRCLPFNVELIASCVAKRVHDIPLEDSHYACDLVYRTCSMCLFSRELYPRCSTNAKYVNRCRKLTYVPWMIYYTWILAMNVYRWSEKSDRCKMQACSTHMQLRKCLLLFLFCSTGAPLSCLYYTSLKPTSSISIEIYGTEL